jgi:uncharacterized coiled-coil protein SlyX
MSDNPTQDMPDFRSFEERVFARFDALDARLTSLEEKVDTRLRETRPIWEAVLTRLTSVEDRLGSLESESRMSRRAMKELSEDVPRTRAQNAELDDDIGKLTERVEKLESKSTS